jgi:hypothetical protein
MSQRRDLPNPLVAEPEVPRDRFEREDKTVGREIISGRVKL